MTLLSVAYKPEEHRPDAFLGCWVSLPELEGLPVQPFLQAPLCSLSESLAFLKGTAFAAGYDRRLDKAHWGVWQARQLEAAFWRLQDALSDAPALPHAFGPAVRTPSDGLGPPTHVRWFLDSYSASGRTWLKTMGLSFVRPHVAPDDFIDIPRETEWPPVAPDEEVLGLPGVRAREEFWKPFSVWSLAEALHAWDATRFGTTDAPFGTKRFSMPTLAAVAGDAEAAFEGTFGPAAGAAFRAHRMNRTWPDGAPNAFGRGPRL